MIIYRNHKPNTLPKDKKYIYTDYRNQIIKNGEIIEKINRFVIPPAWTNVKIDLNPCAKIIYQGYDAANRLQQKYSASHNKKAKMLKFYNLIEFEKAEPRLKSDIKKYIMQKRLSKNKIISIILSIIWICGFRLGNLKFLKLYDSYGISNIRKKHLNIKDNKIYIEFKGKKSVINKCTIEQSMLLTELKKLLSDKKSNDFIFTLNNELIKPTEINNFLRNYGGATSKDLRTLDANKIFIGDIRKNAEIYLAANSNAKRKKVLNKSLNVVAAHLNNTPAISKSSYILTEIYDLAVEQPKKFKRLFFKNDKVGKAFVTYLKTQYCKKLITTI